MKLGNLLDHPTFKISDRRAILQRIYDALLNDKDAMLDFKGTARYTPDETANWQSRQVIADLLLAFPANVPPPSKVETPNTETVDDPAQD